MDLNRLEMAAIVLVAVLAALGVMRGLARTLVGFAMLVFSLVVTVLFAGNVAEVFSDSAAVNAFFNTRSEAYLDEIADKLSDGSINVPISELLPVQGELGQEILAGGSDYLARFLQTEEVRTLVAGKITSLAVKGLGVIVTFVLIRLALGLIGAVIRGFFGSKKTGSADRFLGFLLGVLRGILAIWIAMAAIRIFSFTPTGGRLMALMEESEVLSWLDQNNLVLSVLDNILV